MSFFYCWKVGCPFLAGLVFDQEKMNQGYLSHQNHHRITPQLDYTNPYMSLFSGVSSEISIVWFQTLGCLTNGTRRNQSCWRGLTQNVKEHEGGLWSTFVSTIHDIISNNLFGWNHIFNHYFKASWWLQGKHHYRELYLAHQ